MKKVHLNLFVVGCFGIAMAFIGFSPDTHAIGFQITPRPYYRHYDRYNYGNEWRYGKPSDYDAYYNIKVGKLTLAMTGRMAGQWSDNNNRAEKSRTQEKGWSLIPELTLGVNYPLSPYININFAVSAGYRYYMPHEVGENGFFLSGDSDVAAAETGATIILGENHFITIHDRLTYETDTLANSTYRAGMYDTTSDASFWRNVADIRYTRQLAPGWRTELMYAYEFRKTEEYEFKFGDYKKHTVDWNLWWQMLKTVELGPYFTWSHYNFKTGPKNWAFFDARGSVAGPFPDYLEPAGRNDRQTYEVGMNFNIEDAFGLQGLTLQINGGWEILSSDTNNYASAQDAGPTANFVILYDPKRLINQRFRTSYRRNHTDPNPLVNYADELLLGYGFDVRITDDLIFSADVDWMDINQSDSGDHYNLIRFWLTTTYMITPNTSCDISYRHTEKYGAGRDYQNATDGSGYIVNTIEVGVTHRF